MPAADRWQDLDAEQLLSEWSRGFESTEAAIAHAIWVANRLAKLEPREEHLYLFNVSECFRVSLTHQYDISLHNTA